jgi:hypothetical protein
LLCKSDRRRIVCACLALAVQITPALAASAPTGANTPSVALAQVPGAAPGKQPIAPGLPLRRDADSEGVGTGTAALAAVCVLLTGVWAAAQYRRRRRGGVVRKPGRMSFPWLGHLLPDASGRQLRVVETTSLTSHARLHVVAWQGQEYLVSTAHDKVCILDRRERPPQDEPKEAP